MPIKSPYPSVEVPNVDLWSLWLGQQASYPEDHPLFVEGETGRSYSLAQIREASVALGRGLKHQLKWAKGDVLAFFTANNVDVPVVNLGLHWAGGVASPANPTYTVDELARQLKDSGARALITHRDFLPTATQAAAAVGLPEANILLLGAERDARFRHWTDITAKDAWIQPKKTPVDPQKDLAFLVYSSGTTGLPKGVMLTHSNIVANSRQFLRHDAKFLNWDMDAQLGVLPFFHIYGLSVVVNMTLATGAKCVVMAKFDLPKACQLIQDHSISFLYVPPPIVLALGKEPIVDKYDLSSLRFINSGAAPLSKHLVEAVWNRLRIGVKQGYGLSETSPTTHAQQIDEFWKYQGSVGRLVANMQAKLVDADGKEVPRGEAGEILLKGPNVFGGYWRRPELNKDAFTEDGWYRTGDVGYADRKGNFYITDRIKELIKYKGFQVPPAELEEILVGREDVADACVIGVYDEDRASEVPRAYVVLKEGVAESDALATELVEYVASKVAPPKRLRGGLRFSKEIPKSASGKILRRVLIDKVRKEEGAAPKAKL
jgi:4-coumarate--CoA ligase